MLTFINAYAAQAVLAPIAQAFGVSLTATGWAVTATLIAVAIMAPVAGSISDMIGRKRVIVGAAFALTVPTLAAALAPSFAWLVAARFAQGLTLPFVFTVIVAYMGDEASGAEQIRLAGLYSMGCIFGGFAGRMLAGLAAQAAGWRAAFVALAALTAALAVLLAAWLPAERGFTPIRDLRASARGFAAHLRNPRLLGTCAVGFTVLFSIVSAFTYANFLLAAPPYALGPAALGSVFVVYLLGLVTTPIAAGAAIRFGRRPTMAGACCVTWTGLGLTLLPSLAAIVAGLALVAGGVFIQQSLATGFLAIAVARARSAAVGLYVTCYYVGGSAGGIAPAGIWHRAGWPGCVALAAAVQAAVLAIAWITWRDRVVRA